MILALAGNNMAFFFRNHFGIGPGVGNGIGAGARGALRSRARPDAATRRAPGTLAPAGERCSSQRDSESTCPVSTFSRRSPSAR